MITTKLYGGGGAKRNFDEAITPLAPHSTPILFAYITYSRHGHMYINVKYLIIFKQHLSSKSVIFFYLNYY